MGWTFTHKEKNVSVKDFFQKQFSSSEILECKVVAMRTAYMAVKKNDVVFAVVCLLDYRPNNHFNFGYKDMDETMWPNEAKCPQSILDLLTPTDNENSNNWRAECNKFVESNKKRRTLNVSDTIKFEQEFGFGVYGKTDTFVVVDLKKGIFFAPALHMNVKLTKSNLYRTWENI